MDGRSLFGISDRSLTWSRKQISHVMSLSMFFILRFSLTRVCNSRARILLGCTDREAWFHCRILYVQSVVTMRGCYGNCSGTLVYWHQEGVHWSLIIHCLVLRCKSFCVVYIDEIDCAQCRSRIDWASSADVCTMLWQCYRRSLSFALLPLSQTGP